MLLRAMPRRRAALLACALGGLLLAGAAARADDAQITIDNFTFTPATLTVKAGTRVVWKNQDDSALGGQRREPAAVQVEGARYR